MADPDQDLVFANAVEGLYLRGLAGRITPGLRERVRAAGIDLDRPLLPAYPLEVWAEALRATAELLFADLPLEQGTAELGRMTLRGLEETTLGRAIFALFRVLGPTRLLRRMTRTLRNGTNFVETQVRNETHGGAEVWFNRVVEVGFYEGMLEAALMAAGARDVEVKAASREGTGCVYQIRWKP